MGCTVSAVEGQLLLTTKLAIGKSLASLSQLVWAFLDSFPTYDPLKMVSIYRMGLRLVLAREFLLYLWPVEPFTITILPSWGIIPIRTLCFIAPRLSTLPKRVVLLWTLVSSLFVRVLCNISTGSSTMVIGVLVHAVEGCFVPNYRFSTSPLASPYFGKLLVRLSLVHFCTGGHLLVSQSRNHI